jgi:hypothetical protein
MPIPMPPAEFRGRWPVLSRWCPGPARRELQPGLPFNGNGAQLLPR